MSAADFSWLLVQFEKDRLIQEWPLADGVNLVGRDAECALRFDDPSVSRKHAQATVDGQDLFFEDLGAKNGVKLNGLLKRQKTRLQADDVVRVGDIELRVRKVVSSVASPGRRPTKPSVPTSHEMQGHDEDGPGTIDATRMAKSSDFQKADRELIALVQVCSLVSEGLDSHTGIETCLKLLLEAFNAQEVHWYPATGNREESLGWAAEGQKTRLRLFPFLMEKLQEFPTATIVPGRDIAMHQRSIGEFNFLVGPLCVPEAVAGRFPILVVARKSEFIEFVPTDRTLLQLVCQIWARGQARSIQVQDLRKNHEAQSLQVKDLQRENETLKQKAGVPALLGNSPAMNALREQAKRVAASKATILVLGENGSGKEVVSHFIHEQSPRRDKPFIKVNIAAIPENMIESELFGHVRGAFTGALKARKGKFAAADGGTILLDEIGELPLGVQAKLLRTIESGEVQPLGAEEVSKVDARIIAATNRDLRTLVAQKLFREDLFHRLDRLRVRIPPLREHPEDIDELAAHFLDRVCTEDGLSELSFAPESLTVLRQHNWSGNVRELYAVVQRSAFAAIPPSIGPDVVREAMRQ